MKPSKHLLALFLAAGLCLTCSCGQQQKGASTSGASSSSAASSETEKAVAESGSSAEEGQSEKESTSKEKESASSLTSAEKSSGPSETKVAAAAEKGKARKSFTGTPYKMHILGPDGKTGKFQFSKRDHFAIWPKFEALMKSYGLEPEFEVVSGEQYQSTIQTRMSSGQDLPEFCNVGALGDATIFKMAKQGFILPINDYVEKLSDGTSKAFFGKGGAGERSWLLNAQQDGKVYFISQIQNTTYDGKPGSTNICMTIRQDWLDKLGLKVPKTADEYYAALKAFQEKDVNGNGEKDEVLSLDASDFAGSIAQWYGLVYGIVNFGIEDGKPTKATSPWHQEGIRPYFEFMKKLHDEGLLDPSVIGSEAENQNVQNNRAASVSNYCMATWDDAAVVGADHPRYVPLPVVEGKKGIKPILATEPPSLSYGRWSFTKQASDEAANARLIDMLCSDEYIELTQWGVEGQTFEIDKDGKKQLLPIALHNAYDEAYEKGYTIGDYLWANGGMFPKRRFTPIENELNQVPEYKRTPQLESLSYSYTTPIGTTNYLPVASSEEAERLLQLSTDLNTRSKELAANLILGNESLDKLDEAVAELDQMGLAEMIKITQERLDRAIELGIFK